MSDQEVQAVTLHKYESFEEYRVVQERANAKKLETVWVRKANVLQVAAWCTRHGMDPRVALCHGTRNGIEQRMFSEALPHCAVLGTEISDTAKDFPMTVQWDFHEPLWPGRCDLVYSNSLDHAMQPRKALRNWLASLAPNGVLVIEWGSTYEISSYRDPFGATADEVVGMLIECGAEYLEMQNAASKSRHHEYLKLIYVRRRV